MRVSVTRRDILATDGDSLRIRMGSLTPTGTRQELGYQAHSVGSNRNGTMNCVLFNFATYVVQAEGQLLEKRQFSATSSYGFEHTFYTIQHSRTTKWFKIISANSYHSQGVPGFLS